MNHMRKMATLVLACVLSLLPAGCGKNYQTISQEEARRIMEHDRDCVIVDVRRQEEYDKRHIPHAVLVPIEDIREKKLDALPDKDRTLLVYCWTGRRSEDSAEMLVSYGYKHVYNIGGLVDWTGEVEGNAVNG